MTPVQQYMTIVLTRLNNPLPPEAFGEVHHIVPKSCGGSDDASNLVKLLPEEHFLCHSLLPDIYRTGRNHKSMVYAYRAMALMSGHDVSETEYASLKKEYSACMSKTLRGHTVSEETRAKISMSLKGRPGNRKGCHHTEETRRRLSEATKAYLAANGTSSCSHVVSEETREKLRRASTGKPGYWKGRRRSHETIEKMRLASTGKARHCKPHTAEAKRKMSESLKALYARRRAEKAQEESVQ